MYCNSVSLYNYFLKKNYDFFLQIRDNAQAYRKLASTRGHNN